MLKEVIDYVNDKEFQIHIYKDRININNYIDVFAMEEERISVQSELGLIVIKGENLTVKKLLDREILIIGKLKSIELG